MTDRLKEIEGRLSAGYEIPCGVPLAVRDVDTLLGIIAEKDREIERLRRLLTALDIPTGTIR